MPEKKPQSSPEPVEPNTLKEMAEKNRVTPDMITITDLEEFGKTRVMQVLGEEKAKEADKKNERIYIIQHGSAGFRKGEPAHKVGETVYAHKGDAKRCSWVLKYGDGHLSYVYMDLPTYQMDQVPTWTKVTCSHYLEMTVRSCIRKSWKVVGRD